MRQIAFFVANCTGIYDYCFDASVTKPTLDYVNPFCARTGIVARVTTLPKPDPVKKTVSSPAEPPT